MPPERNQQQPSQTSRHLEKSASLSSDMNAAGASECKRRRGMDLESMLNPPDEDSKASFSPSLSSTSTGTNGDRTLRLAPALNLSSHGPRSRGSSSRSRGTSRGSNGTSRRNTVSPSARSGGSRSSSPPGHDIPARIRSFRPAYSQEHSDFIWFHRIDLNLAWDEVVKAFRMTFSGAHEELRQESGIQCKYYRIRAQHGIPKVRALRTTPEVSSQYGMWVKTGRRYPWMADYAAHLPGK